MPSLFQRPSTPVVLFWTGLLASATSLHFFLLLFFHVPRSVPSSGSVAATLPLDRYGFGSDRALLVLNLSAFSGVESRDGEPVLLGLRDMHPTDKKLATASFFRNGSVYAGIDATPIGIEQKGGWNPQLNMAFEFRSASDLSKDEKVAMIPDQDKYENYYLRGCVKEPSCSRDLAPTVMRVTPRAIGESVEVLFWQAGVGYTYEGVYGLFVDLKRRYFEKTVPWSSKGEVGDDPCATPLVDVGIVFESEADRPDRGGYDAVEATLSAKAIHPKSDVLETQREQCRAVFDNVTEYHRAPNMLNRTVVPLALPTFVQMYVATQLLMQVDFGFLGMQSYYYKSPGSLALSAGPPYDFDAPWDVCGDVDRTPDVEACYPGEGGEVAPSPLWHAMGQSSDFLSELGGAYGRRVLDESFDALDALYARRIALTRAGAFRRHEERWPMSRQAFDLVSHLQSMTRRQLGLQRSTMLDELLFHRREYARRADRMRVALANLTHFDVRVSRRTVFVRALLARFWWVFPAVLLPLVASGASIVSVCRRRKAEYGQ